MIHNLPLISIVVAVFNRESVIERCILSFIDQSYPHKELIVIDGKSTDNTISILERYNDSIAYWMSEPDDGIYHALNKGIRKASGDWIIFLGSDDYFFSSDILTKASQVLAGIDTNSLIAYGKVAYVNSNGDILRIKNKPWQKTKNEFLYNCAIQHQGVFHRKSLFQKYGYFDESGDCYMSADYELLLRYLKNNDAYFIDIVISCFLIGGLSTNERNVSEVRKQLQEAWKKNNIKHPFFRFFLMNIKFYIKGKLLKYIKLKDLIYLYSRTFKRL